ncbi:MAG: thioredoxin domain-containing protein [Akkermansiaceae bacterium]|nr:thioredoxin domain-containing protein [Akkermansiaceae bacterium]
MALLSGAFAVSILLLLADRGGDVLPCFATESAGPQPCEKVKAMTSAQLGFSPSLIGSMGSGLLVFLATLRFSARRRPNHEKVLNGIIRLLFLTATLFCLFLIAQQIRASAWCAACLTLAALMFVAFGIDPWAAKSRRVSAGVLVAVYQLPLLALLILAGLRLPVVTESTFRQQLAKALPELIDAQVLEDIAPCGYSTDHAAVPEQMKWDAPFAHGSAAAPVHLAVFHDPFCALCAQLDAEMQDVLGHSAGRVRLLSFPIPHLDSSLEATRLLHAASLARWKDDDVARMSDTFASLIGRTDADFSREGLAKLLESKGLDVAPLLQEIESGRADESIRRATARFEQSGGTKTPMILINGRVVSETASSARGSCLSRLMDEAAKGRVR